MIKYILLTIIGLLVLSGCSCTPSRLVQVEIIAPLKKIVHPINQDGILKVQGKLSEVSIEIHNRRVRILHSDCPDQICIKAGWISQSYEFILCAPNQVIVRIIGLPERKNSLITY